MSDNIKNPERVAAGLKATVHNPSVSEEAKNRARERLNEMGVDVDSELSSRDAKGSSSSATGSSGFTEEEKTEHHRLGGYKATINNPRVSDAAKEHAKVVLNDSDEL